MNKILIGLILTLLGIGVVILVVYTIMVKQPLSEPTNPAGGSSSISSSNTPSGSTQNNPSGGNSNSSGQTQQPSGGTHPEGTSTPGTTIITSNGGSQVAKDFKKDPALVTDPDNTGYYYLGGYASTSVAASQGFLIEYIESSQFFNVVLLREPLGQVREAAQMYLAEHVGLSEQQLCQLDYMVSVPYSVNQYFAGTSLGFSFCPGAVAL